MEGREREQHSGGFRSGSFMWPVRDCTPRNLFLGLSWPPRSYTCGFCKREFRSAQALGGHMNVHRRDRARLRESPPWEPSPSSKRGSVRSPKQNPSRVLLLNLNSEPQPTTSASTSDDCSSSEGSCQSELRDSRNRKVLIIENQVSAKEGCAGQVSACKVLRRKNQGRGCHQDDDTTTSVKEGLDLDLRLGYA